MKNPSDTPVQEMTPMNRYKTQIQELRNHVSEYFNVVALNKAEPKTKYITADGGQLFEKSGVKSDFILIFSHKEAKVSFALAFDYIGKPLEQQSVLASFKTSQSNADITQGPALSLADFKSATNDFNRWLRDNPLSENTSLGVIDKFADTFLNAPLNIQAQVLATKDVLTQLRTHKSAQMHLDEIKSEAQADAKAYQKAKDGMSEELASAPEVKEMEALKLRMAQLEKSLEARALNLRTKWNILQLENRSDMSSLSLQEAQATLDDYMSEQSQKSTTQLGRRAKP